MILAQQLALVTAYQEITLVLFTSLAPACALCCVIVALPVVCTQHSYDFRARMGRLLAFPLAGATLGLVFSATHLGNPSNALYVLLGVGRSPLSNEVLCAALFLGCAATFWMACFIRREYVFGITRLSLMRLWFGALLISVVAFIASVALAYHVPTILTWYNAWAPASIVVHALFLGPFFAGVLLALSAAIHNEWSAVRAHLQKYEQGTNDCVTSKQKLQLVSKTSPDAHMLTGMVRMCLVVSVIGCVADGIVSAGYGWYALSVRNAVVSAYEKAPYYFIVYVLAILSFLIALGLFAYCFKRLCQCTFLQYRTPFIVMIAASMCAFSGVFALRFLFYVLHMTVGIST